MSGILGGDIGLPPNFEYSLWCKEKIWDVYSLSNFAIHLPRQSPIGSYSWQHSFLFCPYRNILQERDKALFGTITIECCNFSGNGFLLLIICWSTERINMEVICCTTLASLVHWELGLDSARCWVMSTSELTGISIKSRRVDCLQHYQEAQNLQEWVLVVEFSFIPP